MDVKYGDDEISDNKKLRLATLITAQNAAFSDELGRHGQEF